MVENTVDSTTGMVTVRGVMNNENETLWPGILVNTKLIIRTEDAVTVPTAAVQRSQNGNYVFVMKDGKAHVQPVNVSRTFQGISVIANGLVRRRGRRCRRTIAVVGRNTGRAARAQGRGLSDDAFGTLYPPSGHDDAA